MAVETGQVDRRVLFQDLWIEALERAGVGSLHATGSCMLPVLAPGDRVVVEKPSAEGFRVGDVVVFRGAGSLVAHRAVGSFRAGGLSYVVHRGDNSCGRSTLCADRLLGRVVAAVRPDGATVPVISRPPSVLRRTYYSSVAALRHRAGSIKRRLLAR